MDFKKSNYLNMTEQSEKWGSDLGTDYSDRNPKTIAEMDSLYTSYFGITRTTLNKEFLENLPRDIRILEVGTNVGAQLEGLKNLGFTDLTGIDVSKYALEIAKKNCPYAKFIEASALQLPFEDKSFDLVFTSGVLIHISPLDVGKVIDEMCRVLKRYIWVYEYFSEKNQEIEYRGNKNMLWKDNFMKLFLDRHPDLKVVKEKKLKYIGTDKTDQMFLLEKSF